MGNSAADCWNQMVVKPMKVPGDGCEGTKVTTENVASNNPPQRSTIPFSWGYRTYFAIPIIKISANQRKSVRQQQQQQQPMGSFVSMDFSFVT
jgi:hypothetical protein